MKIYVKVYGENSRKSAWFNSEGGESYLEYGEDLEAETEWGEEYLRGTAFDSVAKAKKAGLEARRMMNFEGNASVHVTFWAWGGGYKPEQIKFTPDNKIVFVDDKKKEEH